MKIDKPQPPHLLQYSAFWQRFSVLIRLVIVTYIVITIVTIVVNYFTQLHDPIVDLFAPRPFDLIVLKSPVIVALQRAIIKCTYMNFNSELTRTFFPPALSVVAEIIFAGWTCFCTLAIVLGSVWLGFFMRTTVFVFWLSSGTRMNR